MTIRLRGMPLAAAVVLSVLSACVGPAPTPCTTCDGVCVDTQNDRRHCGACGNACAAGSVCTAGACTASCATGQTTCSGQCVDTRSSPTNCGACGRSCGSNEACVMGTCATIGGGSGDAGVTCQSPLSVCSGVCFDLRNDPGHCGNCTTTCATGEYCTGGNCRVLVVDAGPPPCPTGTMGCNGSCFDQQNDPRNCGMCGRTCNATEYCSAGNCVQFPAMGLDAGTCIASSNPCEIVSATDAGCVVTLRTCPMPGACQTGGTCNATNGACEYQNRTGSCDDSNACTTTDVCQNGACVGTAPTTCATPTACFETSVCIPADGGCTATLKAEGAACDDGDACSGTDTCTLGRCLGSIRPATFDDFSSGAAPNAGRWRIVSADGGAQVSVAAGQLVVNRSALVVAAQSYAVASSSAVRITGEFTSGVTNDWAHVWTRTSGVPGSAFQLDSGVEFIVKPDQLELRNNGVSVATAVFDGGLAVGAPVVFEVFDDGARAQLSVHTKGAANELLLSAAISGAASGSKVVFANNNDGAPTAGSSRFDLLRIEHGVRTRPSREWTFEEVVPTAVAGNLLGGFGMLPDGGSSGAKAGRFVSAGGFLSSTTGTTVAGAVTSGAFGAAASITPTSGGRFVELPSDIITATGRNLSVSLWYLGTGPNGMREIFGNRTEGSGGTFLSIRGNPVGASVEFDQSSASAYTALIGVSPAREDDAQWHHLVVTREGQQHAIYIDGVLAADRDAGVTYPIANFAKSTPYWAGRGYDSRGSGAFDELRIYDDVALNACEVSRLSTRNIDSASCTGGRTLCVANAASSGVCVDVQTDVSNCGACGVTCTAGANGAAACAAGSCTTVCSPGFLDCNGLAIDGCEVRAASCVNAPVLVSVGLDGGAGNGNSVDPNVDDSGKLVVFTSTATNLVPNDTNGQPDVFLRNLITNTTTRLSTGPAGQQLAEGGFGGTISADGRFAAFITTGPAIVPDTNGAGNDVIVIDLTNNTRSFGITSTTLGQPQGNTESFSSAVLSRDGRYVMWSTRSTGLFAGDAIQGEGDIYIFDRQIPVMRMASLNSMGGIVPQQFGSNGSNTGSSFFSGNGRWVSYNTFAFIFGFIPDDCSHGYFVEMNPGPVPTRLARDNNVGLLTCTTQADSAANLLANNAGTSFFFDTRDDPVTGAVRGTRFIYRRPAINGASTLIASGNGDSSNTFLSDDGLALSFISTATNLPGVPMDANGTARDCFVWRSPTTITNVSQPVVRALGGANGCNYVRLSRGGQYAVLDMQDALSAADQNAFSDIYVRPVP
ncbi:MAG: hypothetical protein GQE15_20390 [Archangiaceae bacterium]|nr:hypothetical protein [Archangiaceae bacterium]